LEKSLVHTEKGWEFQTYLGAPGVQVKEYASRLSVDDLVARFYLDDYSDPSVIKLTSGDMRLMVEQLISTLHQRLTNLAS
jgi:hypothetical protein